jgi:O-antigen/teichoic acid export membrane protein
MVSESSQERSLPSEKGIRKRFMSLLSAQGVDGVFNTIFFLYLAWLDSTIYGAIMYSLAAGIVVMKIVQFGLYYPLVSDLSNAPPDEAPTILNRVNIIKLGLFIPCMLAVLAGGFYRGFSQDVTIALVVVCLGFSLEALAETFFADFRVRGKQVQEARIKIVSAVISYIYGFVVAALGFNLIVISFFKIISGIVRIGYGLAAHVKEYSGRWIFRPEWPTVYFVFKAASVFALIEILGILYNKTNVFFLESYVGLNGVAYYSATFNIIDEISVLASEQFLGWVIFPLLAAFWGKDRNRSGRLVKATGVWLFAFGLPIMFVLHAESPLIIGLVYPSEYKDAVWMQQYLVWTIVLSFENNLFAYLMMVAGKVKILLLFSLVAAAANLLFNVALVPPLGLLGGCLVIIFTKLVMTVLTFVYCRVQFRFVKEKDFLFPILLGAVCYGVFMVLEHLITLHPAVLATLAMYLLALRQFGTRFLGPLPRHVGPS